MSLSALTTMKPAVNVEFDNETSWEINARNFTPEVDTDDEDDDELLWPPQLTSTSLVSKTPATTMPALFKPGTPKSMMDKDLDAKFRIITELISVPRCLRGEL